MKALAEANRDIDGVKIYGRVVGRAWPDGGDRSPIHAMSVGARIVIETGGNRFIPSEVIGFSGNNAVVMPFAGLEGVRAGAAPSLPMPQARCGLRSLWLGACSRDGRADRRQGGRCRFGPSPMPFCATGRRRRIRGKRVGAPLDLGVRALNTFSDLLRGQRLRHLRRLRRRQVGICFRCWHAMWMRISP